MNNNLVKILKVKKGFFKNKILIEALGNCENLQYIQAGFHSQWRCYYINKNHKQWIRIPKSFIFNEGESVNFSSICRPSTYKQFGNYKKLY